MLQTCATMIIFTFILSFLYRTGLWKKWLYATKTEYYILKNALLFFAVITAFLGIF